MVTETHAAAMADMDALILLGRRTFIETYKGMGDVRPDGLEEQYGLETFNYEKLEAVLAGTGLAAAVHFEMGTVDGRPVGYMRLDFECSMAHLTQAYVLKEFKGLGLGTQFIERARQLARERGYGILRVAIYDKNAAALRFYRKMGFVEVGHQPWTFYYKGSEYADNDVVMSLPL